MCGNYLFLIIKKKKENGVYCWYEADRDYVRTCDGDFEIASNHCICQINGFTVGCTDADLTKATCPDYENWEPYGTGCNVDQDARTLTERKPDDFENTIERCATQCEGFKYFGVEVGIECFCGDELTIDQPSTGCNDDCAGNANQICGGTWAISIYEFKTIGKNNCFEKKNFFSFFNINSNSKFY